MLEPFQVVFQRFVVFIQRIFFDNCNHGCRVHKSGQVVDVAVGVVSCDTVSQPPDLLHPEEVAEKGFNVAFAETRITVRIQQTRFACEDGSSAIGVIPGSRAGLASHMLEPGVQIERCCL
jgi:hypothetical protein